MELQLTFAGPPSGRYMLFSLEHISSRISGLEACDILERKD